MRYKDAPKKRKLKASDEIRQKYAAKPIIALYQDEVDAIIDHVLEDDLEGFYAWLDEWRKFIFKEANVVIKPRAKGDSMYVAYTVLMDRIKVTAFSDEGDDCSTFAAFPNRFDIEDMEDFIGLDIDRGTPWGSVTISVSNTDYKNLKEKLDLETTYYKERMNAIMAEMEPMSAEFDTLVDLSKEQSKSDPKADKPESKFVAQRIIDIGGKLKEKKEEAKSIHKMCAGIEGHFAKKMYQLAKRRVALTILATLYHFQVRTPKTYLAESAGDTEGYKKHNDLYNPLKRLTPPAIVRPKNGTRSWFETQRMKHTESWHVKGHSRVLRAERYKEKRGQTIWINPFIKGTGENMRLSIYADQIAGNEIVEVGED